MSDIVERLRTEGAMKDYYDVPALQRDAADEIERLREEVRQLRVEAGYDHIASADCWCKPTELEEGIFVHNSMDRKEKREDGGLQ